MSGPDGVEREWGDEWDAVADVVVVGSGVAGRSAAIAASTAASRPAEVGSPGAG